MTSHCPLLPELMMYIGPTVFNSATPPPSSPIIPAGPNTTPSPSVRVDGSEPNVSVVIPVFWIVTLPTESVSLIAVVPILPWNLVLNDC